LRRFAPLAWWGNVVVIHDAAALRHPEWYARSYVAWQRAGLPTIARSAVRVISPSSFSRDEVVELLRERPLRAGEVAERLGVSRPAMSNHLRALRSSGLVDVELSEEDGRARRYRLRGERFRELQGWLLEVEGHWVAQLESFRDHAERGREGSP